VKISFSRKASHHAVLNTSSISLRSLLQHPIAISELFTAMEIQVEVFWVATPCSSILVVHDRSPLRWRQQGHPKCWWYFVHLYLL